MESVKVEKPWKTYTIIVVETLLAFYLATFSLIMYFFHRQLDTVVTNIILVLLYCFVLFVCSKRLIDRLPIAVLMILVPIVPLFALIVVVTMIPILQVLG